MWNVNNKISWIVSVLNVFLDCLIYFEYWIWIDKKAFHERDKIDWFHWDSLNCQNRVEHFFGDQIRSSLLVYHYMLIVNRIDDWQCDDLVVYSLSQSGTHIRFMFHNLMIYSSSFSHTAIESFGYRHISDISK